MLKKIDMNPQKSTLYKYAQLLADCKRARLTGTRGADDIYNLQILDCIESLKYLPDTGKIIDVGTGGGLPGIVWAVYRPDLSVVLLDSINKKCEAVQEIINSLGIQNAKIICARSEDFAHDNREVFSLAGAKALASAGVTAELLSPLVKVGGKLITFKGERVHEELSEVNNCWLKLGLSKPEINYYAQDEGNSSKCLVIWEKIKSCPKEFPRRTGLAGTKKFWE
ncbi:MAG: 16S rRNA (guanine(527)-N(7))-methyltransferase RsmG [Synergistaceae bacterium]|nr:16S rRNA (guanine(527)-N(7))-methyltransferase RsmG [Synergistaceae bacterium]